LGSFAELACVPARARVPAGWLGFCHAAGRQARHGLVCRPAWARLLTGLLSQPAVAGTGSSAVRRGLMCQPAPSGSCVGRQGLVCRQPGRAQLAAQVPAGTGSCAGTVLCAGRDHVPILCSCLQCLVFWLARDRVPARSSQEVWQEQARRSPAGTGSCAGQPEQGLICGLAREPASLES
jgi:hypothetical protein